MPFAIFFKDNPRDNIISMDLDNINNYKTKNSIIPGYKCIKFYSDKGRVIIIQTKK